MAKTRGIQAPPLPVISGTGSRPMDGATTRFLAALDFDGTSDDSGEAPLVHPLVLQALWRAVRRGWRWVLVSDRRRGDLLRVAASLAKDLRPAALVAQRRVIELLDSSGNYRPHLGWNTARAREHEFLATHLAPHVDQWAADIRASFRVRVELVDDGAFGFVVYPEDVPALRARLVCYAADIPCAVVTNNHESVSIVHSSFCKGRALREVTTILGVGRHRTCAIGDATNDLPMLRSDTSALAGCPGDAAPEVRTSVAQRSGGYLASSDGARGTAELLDTWVTTQQPMHLRMNEPEARPMHSRRPRLLVHSYGLLDDNRRVVAGSRMSGLSLYTTLLVEGLSPSYAITLVCGSLKSAPAEPRRLREGLTILEYDARFPQHFERNGVFHPQLAQNLYQDRVSDPDNPIYSHLASVYARVVAATQPDVVNTHNPNAGCAAIHAMLRGVHIPPLVVTIHDVHAAQIEFLARYQAMVEAFVAISESVRDSLCSAGVTADRIRTIPNGIDLRTFFEVGDVGWPEVAQQHHLPTDEAFTVLVPARRVRGKGIDLAIRAFDQLAARRPEQMRLIISGAGLAEPTYERELRVLAQSATARDSIYFLDAVSYGQMPALFRASDVSLLPSTAPEGFGYANIEAMATGGPVVVSAAHGGPLDYMRHGENGLLFAPHDAESLARSLERALISSDACTSLREHAKETARCYTKELMIEGYRECFQAFSRDRSSL